MAGSILSHRLTPSGEACGREADLFRLFFRAPLDPGVDSRV